MLGPLGPLAPLAPVKAAGGVETMIDTGLGTADGELVAGLSRLLFTSRLTRAGDALLLFRLTAPDFCWALGGIAV